jgi:hypothetical protein
VIGFPLSWGAANIERFMSFPLLFWLLFPVLPWMFVRVVMVALPAFRLGITLGLGSGAAHAGGNAFLESRKN